MTLRKSQKVLTTAKRFGLRNNHKLASGLTHTHFHLFLPWFPSLSKEDSSIILALSIPLVSGWLVSGKKKKIARNARRPQTRRANCMSRQEA
jgi:hypothetical protein